MGPTSHANKQVIQKVSLKVPNGPSVPKRPMMRLSGPRVVPDGTSVSKSYPKKTRKA